MLVRSLKPPVFSPPWKISSILLHAVPHLPLQSAALMDAFSTILSTVAYISSFPVQQTASFAGDEELPKIEPGVDFDKGTGSCGSCVIA
ncbi:hypothetical protein R3P38DRAFT_3217100 [Favolaschia claudopus]|uniref:Uncharacterized protein n=1 Tax=Favolaschia claudopus TaxID=2862362 RepID=A0AAW0A6Q1_9AGAR